VFYRLNGISVSRYFWYLNISDISGISVLNGILASTVFPVIRDITRYSVVAGVHCRSF